MLQADVRLRKARLDLEATIDVQAGETLAVLGPNGAGKTTLLRALAGLEMYEGSVTLDGRPLDGLPPEKRSCGFVFQGHALFPHLDVRSNIAFGLSRADEAQADTWLERLGISDLGRRRPAQLSGGQRQKVALARALARRPRLLLLDEPTSALDASARVEVRRELARELDAFAGIRLLVTHDPVEAAALSTELLVLEDGKPTQRGTLAEVTARPRSAYVADLAGLNLLRGHAGPGLVTLESGVRLAAPGAPDGDVFVTVHPRAVALHRRRPEGTPRNVWPGEAAHVELLGDRARVQVLGGRDGPNLVAEVTPAAVDELQLDQGGRVWISVKATELTVYRA
jgi:molybdate transport system ATP-binding protein